MPENSARRVVMPAAELDPLSQLIGALSAQVQGLASQLTDLRSEIVTNRTFNQAKWDDINHKLDLVQAEYRNIKHGERGLEQEKVALDARLSRMENRLTEIETQISRWRGAAAVIVGIAAAVGAVLQVVLSAVLHGG